jgi:hypothetical protein
MKSSVALVCGFGLSICYQYRVCVCVCVCVCLHVLRRQTVREAIAVVSELSIIAVAALGESYKVVKVCHSSSSNSFQSLSMSC